MCNNSSYIECIKSDIKIFLDSSKNYWIIFVFFTTLTFGFTLTNHSIGVDDEAFSRYFEGNGLLSQGRLGSYILKNIFDSYYFLPFWRDFLAVTVIMISVSVLFFYLWKQSDYNLSLRQGLIFSICVISCPVIAEYFIFMSASIEIGLYWLFTGIALILKNDAIFFKENRIWNIFASILFLIWAISFSEAAVPLFIAVSFMGLFISKYYQSRKLEYQNAHFVKYAIDTVLVVAVSMVLKQIISSIIMMVTKVNASGYVNGYIKWNLNNISESIQIFINEFINMGYTYYNNYYHMKVFIWCIVIFLLISILISIIRKEYFYIVLWGIITISTVSLIIITGNPYMPQRTMIIYSVYIGFVCMLITSITSNKNIKMILLVCLILLACNQSREMNMLFYNDYNRYKLDLEIVRNISREIELVAGETVPVKPIAFIGVLDDSYSIPKGEVIGQSLLRWDRMWGNETPDRIYNFFNMIGYDYSRLKAEDYEKAKHDSVTMKSWPERGAVREFEDYIIVKMGDSHEEHYNMSIEEFRDILNLSNDNIDGWINNISVNNNKLYIQGWALFKDFDSKNTKIKLLIESKDNQYLVLTNQFGTLTDHFNNGINYENVNFYLDNYDISNMVPGDYNLGILLETRKKNAYFNVNYSFKVNKQELEL